MSEGKIPDACPLCGSTDAITRERPIGTVSVRYDLESRTFDCDGMFEGLDFRGGSVLYCDECGKRLGRREDAEGFREVSETF